ncbi:Urease accessory protein UreD [Methylobacterium gnaphalii]|uniref:Urease accessory protein UreD n=1 Tax=Methylobacterium gnaphalii TaxID=1010610 RepID=A0A512JMM2_9HYPH|nr:urease accessory protein UreD [Methylobacterium gnaphalii]GJD70094.1 Urease accessory protein UreD [Methylobacterium gnaphalii]GLS49730.1 urease accessory protein UreD [Methylobacterium gnaphalii]
MAAPPVRQRSQGNVSLTIGDFGGRSRVRDLSEAGPLRLRFPNVGDGTLEGIQVNTAGGVACGDHFETVLDLHPGTAFVLTTTAAEKIYKSDGPTSTIVNRATVAAGATLAWLPQETILFDRSRLRRRFEADLAGDAGLLVVELVAFGRTAHGERLNDAMFEDVWRIRRDGHLTYADTLRFDGPIEAMLARSAICGGARALGTIIDLSPGAESRLDEARALIGEAGQEIEAGASAWNGHLAIRLLGPAIGSLRVHVARFLAAYRGTPMPRVWQT